MLEKIGKVWKKRRPCYPSCRYFYQQIGKLFLSNLPTKEKVPEPNQSKDRQSSKNATQKKVTMQPKRTQTAQVIGDAIRFPQTGQRENVSESQQVGRITRRRQTTENPTQAQSTHVMSDNQQFHVKPINTCIDPLRIARICFGSIVLVKKMSLPNL